MMSNAGFVGFDGTENKRTILALHQVKEVTKADGDVNALLQKPFALAESLMTELNYICGVKASKQATPETTKLAILIGVTDMAYILIEGHVDPGLAYLSGVIVGLLLSNVVRNQRLRPAATLYRGGVNVEVQRWLCRV